MFALQNQLQMETKPTVLTATALANAPIEKVWKCWTTPSDIRQWNHASPDWHCPEAALDLTVGGSFLYRMEAKDGSFGFDFAGTFDEMTAPVSLAYTMGDGRKATIRFTEVAEGTRIQEQFEAESQNTLELQQQGWQAILDNFKTYVEAA